MSATPFWHSTVMSAKALQNNDFLSNAKAAQIVNEVRGNEVIMAKTKFRPLHDRVVVKRIDAEEKSKGGIIIPDTVKEKPQEGEVVAVGPGGRDESRQAHSDRRQGRRPRAVRQVVGHRGEARR